VRRGDGTVALYMHLREMKLGGTVTKGRRIGLASGPHLSCCCTTTAVPVTSADAPKLARGVRATAGNCP